MNRPFDPACLSERITINKLYFIPKLVVSASAETAEVWARACLCLAVALNSVLQRSSRIASVFCKPDHLFKPG